MPNVEVTLSPNYVEGWGIWEATRELLQNAYDQATVNPDNLAIVTYDPALQVLKIGNRSSNLDVSTLVLGKSSKGKDDRTIGQFGEGYKLALIVLLRLGKSVTIYNNPNVWTPTIKMSTQFNTPVLNINIVKYRFKELPEHDLIFEVRGITSSELELIRSKDRTDHEASATLNHDYGKILLDERYKGQIFVKGLYVTTLEDLRYGYDIKPQYLEIGRDRNLVNAWTIINKTSQMWAKQSECPALVNELLESNAKDVQMMESCVWQMPEHTVEYIRSGWYCQHGSNAIPCKNEAEAKKARSIHGAKANIIIVTEQLMAILKGAPQFKELTAKSITKSRPKELLGLILDHPDKTCLTQKMLADITEIVQLAENWTWAEAAPDFEF